MPAADSAGPTMSNGRGPVRPRSWEAIAAPTTMKTVIGRKAKPDRMGE